MARFVVGVSGASGTILARRAVAYLAQAGHEVELILSKAACLTAAIELGESYGSASGFIADLPNRDRIRTHRNSDFGAKIASGSHPIQGTLIIPASMATVAAIAIGLSDNLIRRAAEVALKERRSLVIVPREAPLTEANLDNMARITRMGGTIFPPVPAWYLHPKSLEDVENFIVGRCLDLLGVPNDLYQRWEGCAERL
jgi:flavin prenyltransferase